MTALNRAIGYTVLAALVSVLGGAERTPDGMEICQVWKAPMPKAGVAGAGLPLLENARHKTIFEPTREEGAYNHHAELIWHRGKFYAMWSNHPHGEDMPGQRVLFAATDSFEQWPRDRELFPAPGSVLSDVERKKPRGTFSAAFFWIPKGERLFAVASVLNAGPIAREVHASGELGPIFRLWRRPTELLAHPALEVTDSRVAEEAAYLNKLIGTADYWPWWDFWNHFPEPDTATGRKLVEPTVHRAHDGNYVMHLRDSEAEGGYSHRVFMSISRDGGRTWPPAWPTNIPDSPSRRDIVTLPNGTVLLVGNQVAPAFDNGRERKHYDRDPLTVAVSRNGYDFERAYALRWHLPRDFRHKDVHGRGRGAQYPSAIVRDETLYVLYTIGKEDVGISWVRLRELGL